LAIKYLLDTNILSELSKQKPNVRVVECVNKYGNLCATASLVMHELNYGVLSLPAGKRQSNLTLFLKQLENHRFPVLAYDATAAQAHAVERAYLTSQGSTPAFVDGQIAAIALVNNLTLVTRNSKDFMNFRGLLLENWFDESANPN
jgi:tRNA(fMet)-specific endonuclease VapC